MRLIGLGGFKTAGKDSAFLAIQKALPDLNVQRVGFADKLKVLAAGTLGYEGSDERQIELMNECKEDWQFRISEHEDHFTTFSGRQYLQWLGQHARIVFGDDFWINQVLPYHEKLTHAYPGVDVLAVTDVRYQNEAERVLALNGEVWRIDRPGVESDGHASEVPLPDDVVNTIIVNDSDLAGLEGAVAKALTV